MSSKTLFLNDQIYSYLKETVREPEVLAELRQATASVEDSAMQITPEQGQLMHLLCLLTGARKTLEVGVYTGYSSLAAALALPEDGQVIACDVSEEWTSIGRPFWEKAAVAHKIDLRLAPACETLEALLTDGQAGSFDFAFIDADKVNYRNYYELSLKLLRPGGLIAVDNTLWGGSVANPEKQSASTLAIRELNAFISQDERVDSSLLPIGDGLFLARKR